MAEGEISVTKSGVVLTWKVLVGAAVFVLGTYVSQIIAPITSDVKLIQQELLRLVEEQKKLQQELQKLRGENEQLRRMIYTLRPDTSK